VKRSAFSALEILIAAVIGVVCLSVAYMFLRSARVSTESTLGPQMGLQQAARKALVEMIKEVQESIEIVRPPAGATLTYFIARDKLDQILTVYLVKEPNASAKAGRDIHDLMAYRHDYGATPPKADKILSGIERAAFTSLSSGLLQIHFELHENGKTYPLLTTVRCRNILPEGEL
jgi:hypothetical protein